MGNKASHEDKVGYRVLGVQPNSPAAKCGLVSFFDFIIEANGVPLRSLDTTFIELIKNSEETPLELTVYNCKNHSIRKISLTPSRNWPGEGMLGVTIRFDSFHEAEENMCHVIDVETNSPAELAGLIPQKDYLLGTAEKVLKDTEILFQELVQNIDKPIEMYVYNVDTDEVRIVVIMPTRDWGGEGILGANIAHGYLHSLPAKCCQTIGISNEGNINKIINSPFGLNMPTTNGLSYNHFNGVSNTNNETNKENFNGNVNVNANDNSSNNNTVFHAIHNSTTNTTTTLGTNYIKMDSLAPSHTGGPGVYNNQYQYQYQYQYNQQPQQQLQGYDHISALTNNNNNSGN